MFSNEAGFKAQYSGTCMQNQIEQTRQLKHRLQHRRKGGQTIDAFKEGEEKRLRYICTHFLLSIFVLKMRRVNWFMRGARR